MELTSIVQRRFKFLENSVELYTERVNNRGLCAVAQAESLRYKLLGGLAVHRKMKMQGSTADSSPVVNKYVVLGLRREAVTVAVAKYRDNSTKAPADSLTPQAV